MSVIATATLAQTATDFFILRNGQRRDVVITRADPKNLYYQTPNGEASMPWPSIKSEPGSWNLADRQGVREALAAADAGQYAAALKVLKPLAERYMVLPVPWVQDVVVAVVRCHTELKQMAEADAVAKKFSEYQPAQANRVKPYLALALAGQNKNDEAIALLGEVVKAGETKLVISTAEARMLGLAYLAMGDCYAAKGDDARALECYLTTTVLYYQDETTARQAQARADALKKKLQPQTAKTSNS